MSLRKLLFGKPDTSTSLESDTHLSYIKWLPNEILLPILVSLNTTDLLAFRQTSRSNNAVSTDARLWKSRFFQAYPSVSNISEKENYFPRFLEETKKRYSKISINEKQFLNLVCRGDLKSLQEIENAALIKLLLNLIDKSQEEKVNCNTEYDHLNPFNIAYQKGFQQILDHFYQIYSEAFLHNKDKKSDLIVMAVRCNQESVIEKNFSNLNAEQQGLAIWIVIRYGYTSLIEGCLSSEMCGKFLLNDCFWGKLLIDPIWLAVAHGKTTALKTMLKCETEADKLYTWSDLLNHDMFQFAAKAKHANVIKILLQYEADRINDPAHKHVILSYFTYGIGRLQKLYKSVEHDKQPSQGFSNLMWKTTLQLALEEKPIGCSTPAFSSETALALLEACSHTEFDPNQQDYTSDEHSTALHLAVKRGLVDVVEKLIQFEKLDVLIKDKGEKINDSKIAYDRIPPNDKNKDKIAYLLLKKENFLLTLNKYLDDRNNEPTHFFGPTKAQKLQAASELKNQLETIMKSGSSLELHLEDLKALNKKLIEEKNSALLDGRLKSIFERIIMFIKLKEKFEPAKKITSVTALAMRKKSN